MSSQLVSAVIAQLQNADERAVAEAVAKAEAADIAAYVKKHLQPVVDSVVPEFLGVNASKSHAAFPAIVEASALLIGAKLISDAIREVGRETVKSLDEIESAVMVNV